MKVCLDYDAFNHTRDMGDEMCVEINGAERVSSDDCELTTHVTEKYHIMIENVWW